MRIIEKFRRFTEALGRMLGIGKAPVAVAVEPAKVDVERIEPTVAFAAEVPAVAAYERRVSRTDFRLPSRLLSVADLNIKAGRVPYQRQQRITATKPIATAAIGGKKVREIQGPVVYKKRQRPTAAIIQLPQRPRLELVAAQSAA